MSTVADLTTVASEPVAAEPEPTVYPARRPDRPFCPCCAVWLFGGLPVEGREGDELPP